MSRRIVTRTTVSAALLTTYLSVPSLVRANGEAEYVAPLDRPVSSAPDRPLPYAVVEEPAPRGLPPLSLKAFPSDASFVTTENFASSKRYNSASGAERDCFESLVVRDLAVTAGKLTIPAGGLSYVAEALPLALPFQQDVLCIAGTPYTLIDFEQSIVTRKAVTITQPEAVALGSELFHLKSVTEFGNARSAVIEITSIAGFNWAELGTGSLEVSTTEPGWHAKTFHYGLHQGRVEEVTPKSVRFAWLSALRTDSILVAAKREASGQVVAGSEVNLAAGGKIRVVSVEPAQKRVDIETPDGKKTLSLSGDTRFLPADTALRRKLIVRGRDYAVLLVPDASDFPNRKPHLEVYSELREYRHGEVAPADDGFKIYLSAHYNGGILGVHWVNERPLELTPSAGSVSGPHNAFKLVSTWNERNLAGVQLEDKQGAKSVMVPANGRPLTLVAGAGPTLEALMAKRGVGIATRLHDALLGANSKPGARAETPTKPLPTKAPEEKNRYLELLRTTPGLLWVLAGLAVGLILGYLVGRAGRRVVHSWE